MNGSRSEIIGILTIHSNYKNMGCVLQAYSTYYYLKKCGYTVEIIDHRYPDKLAAIGAICNASQLALQRFIESMPLSPSFVDQNISEVVRYIKQRYGLVIFGSDEIWKWKVEQDGSQRKVSHTVPAPNIYWPIGLDTPHIAYAASIGSSNTPLPAHIASHFSKSLQEFSQVGARDVRTAKLVKQLSGITPDIVPDPAYLNDLTPECDPDLIKFKLKKAGANFAKPVLGIYTPTTINANGLPAHVSVVNLSLAELSPIEFWYAPKLLSCMLTNSHHGVIVAMIQNTPCVVAPKHPLKVSDHVEKYKLRVGASIVDTIKNWDHQHVSSVVESERAITRNWLLNQCRKWVPGHADSIAKLKVQ